jgi:hypothetical protein
MSRPTLRKTTFRGLPINVEIEVGDTKSGTDAGGQAWSKTYSFPYGEIDKTEGADGDPVDVYLGPNEQAENVYVVHQSHRDLGGDGRLYDEDKVLLGFDSMDAAVACYFAHGPAWGMGAITVFTFEQFQEYLKDKRGPRRGWNALMFGGAS